MHMCISTCSTYIYIGTYTAHAYTHITYINYIQDVYIHTYIHIHTCIHNCIVGWEMASNV